MAREGIVTCRSSSSSCRATTTTSCRGRSSRRSPWCCWISGINVSPSRIPSARIQLAAASRSRSQPWMSRPDVRSSSITKPWKRTMSIWRTRSSSSRSSWIHPICSTLEKLRNRRKVSILDHNLVSTCTCTVEFRNSYTVACDGGGALNLFRIRWGCQFSPNKKKNLLFEEN